MTEVYQLSNQLFTTASIVYHQGTRLKPAKIVGKSSELCVLVYKVDATNRGKEFSLACPRRTKDYEIALCQSDLL